MDHHTVAAISIAGIILTVLGTLYLAYDLLGGQHGPLRLLTRVVTYSSSGSGTASDWVSFSVWLAESRPVQRWPLNSTERLVDWTIIP